MPTTRLDLASDTAAVTATGGEEPVIVDRPDGYYWLSPDGRQEFGPYESHELAQAAGRAAGAEDATQASVEELEQAEREIGIADWIDPETGEPAEGQSPPHLQED